MATFRGSICKAGCGGHRAGYRYASRGGRLKSPWSASFNRGMAIAISQRKKRKKKKKK